MEYLSMFWGRVNKGYSARKLLEEFPDKDWSCSALDRLPRQIDTATGSADRKSGSSRKRTVCTREMQMSLQMLTTLSTNCNWWYCVRTGEATFPYWKLLFLSSIFTALHKTQTRSSDENSVCPSVCQTRGLWQNVRKICLDFYTIRKTI